MHVCIDYFKSILEDSKSMIIIIIADFTAFQDDVVVQWLINTYLPLFGKDWKLIVYQLTNIVLVQHPVYIQSLERKKTKEERGGKRKGEGSERKGERGGCVVDVL